MGGQNNPKNPNHKIYQAQTNGLINILSQPMVTTGNWGSLGAGIYQQNSHPAKFNQGDYVVQINIDSYDSARIDTQSNPIWGMGGIYMKGVVVDVTSTNSNHGYTYIVNWDNGSQNMYQNGSTLDNFSKHQKELEKAQKRKKITLDTSKLDALIIDPKVKAEIVAVLKQHNNAGKMFDEWGLGDIIEYGRGMTFLFHGTPGTGKTWAANRIAKALNTELLVISASQIQSSEPGGANRNIENAFATASEQSKVLFLDECDSLITVRSDVGMILGSEINTLLTEIEKFEGVCILATNRIDTLDEALERRISLIIEFPKPNFAQREEIWGRMLPAKMPVGEGVTKTKLAECTITGGQIKNVVLQAARLALAEDSPVVEAKHFDQAFQRVLSSKSLMGKTSRYTQTDYVKI